MVKRRGFREGRGEKRGERRKPSEKEDPVSCFEKLPVAERAKEI